jgi:GDP-mannose 4,6-dehydratase
MSSQELLECRICKNNHLIDIITLGDQTIASQFPLQDEPNPPSIPLTLVKCHPADTNHHVCGLVQLKHTAPPSELYCKTYGYRSGLNNTMMQHLKTIVEDALRICSLEENDYILDIGGNDATLLKWYDQLTTKTIHRISIDPTGKQFAEFYPEKITLFPDFFYKENWEKAVSSNTIKAKIVTSIAMFYDLPDPIAFAQDVKDILHSEGVWIIEQSYLPTMIQCNSFDTICHEHLEYYCLRQIQWICDRVGLKIIHISFNDCNGGSFRVIMSHKESSYATNTTFIQEILEKEQAQGYDTLEPYQLFMERCEYQKHLLQQFIQGQVHQGKKICVYGASTKGNTLLQYYHLDKNVLLCAAERNPIKYGRRTPLTDIPIVSEAEVRKIKPEFMFVLPWHFKKEFLEREKEYLTEGGQFIFPLPYVDIITNSKKAIITGITGQIGTYMKQYLLSKGYIVYGVVSNIPNTLEKGVYYIQGNLLERNFWKDLIYTIHPDEIYHFAGYTDSYKSHTEVGISIEVNSKPIEHALDVLYHYKQELHREIPFFQSSSIQQWMGNTETEYTENTPFSPLNPYGIGKLHAHWLCKYYRESKGLPIYQGIFSNIESPLRKDVYITKKITNYIKSLLQDGYTAPLSLGNVYVYRDWMHIDDAIRAVYTIMQSNQPEDYIIASGFPTRLKDLIELAFQQVDIRGVWNELDQFIENNTQRILVQSNKELYQTLQGDLCKIYHTQRLRNLGWKPEKTLVSILQEMISS